jgi:hypothetical protein
VGPRPSVCVKKKKKRTTIAVSTLTLRTDCLVELNLLPVLRFVVKSSRHHSSSRWVQDVAAVVCRSPERMVRWLFGAVRSNAWLVTGPAVPSGNWQGSTYTRWTWRLRVETRRRNASSASLWFRIDNNKLPSEEETVCQHCYEFSPWAGWATKSLGGLLTWAGPGR